MGSRRDKLNRVRLENDITFTHYLDRLTELAMSRFEYVNLPKSVNERFMERTLFGRGLACFFKDELLSDSIMCLPCAQHAPFDCYNEPTARRVFAANGYNKELTNVDSVVIWNNLLHTPSLGDIRMYASRLAELEKVISINVNAQKTPVLLECDENTKKTLEVVYADYEGGAPVIAVDKDLGDKPLKVMVTGAPYVADKVYDLKMKTWNEALTYLGISNMQIEKKERLITDEVNRSQGGVIASRLPALESRRTAIEKVNEMFGTDIKVDYRLDVIDTAKRMTDEMRGGESYYG